MNEYGHVEPNWGNTLDARNIKLYPTIRSGCDAAKKGEYIYVLLANKHVYDINYNMTDSIIHNGYITNFH